MSHMWKTKPDPFNPATACYAHCEECGTTLTGGQMEKEFLDNYEKDRCFGLEGYKAGLAKAKEIAAEHIEVRESTSCPDDNPGCAVLHQRKVQRVRNGAEIREALQKELEK